MWTRRVETQRVHKALIKATKENEDFNAIKKQEEKSNSLDKMNQEEKNVY